MITCRWRSLIFNHYFHDNLPYRSTIFRKHFVSLVTYSTMSMKSQFSIEDLQEIWDQSISFNNTRSSSEDSFSCADESECLSRELLKALSPPMICKLRKCFKKSQSTSTQDVHRRVEQIMRQAAAEEGIQFKETQPLRDKDKMVIDETSFITAIDKLFGGPKYSVHASCLFHVLDPFDTRRILWGDLLDKLVAVGARQTRSRADRWERVSEQRQRMVVMDHCKRETIVKLVSIKTEDTFCYAAVSKGGRVGLYSGDLQHITHYELWYHRTGLRKRVKNSWVTDAVYMSDVQYLVISSSDRSLSFYEASTTTHILVYCVTGMREIPTCLAYDAAAPLVHEHSSELMIGDSRGQIIKMLFLRPRISLFHNTFTDKLNSYFWMELPSPPHTSYVSISLSRPHSQSVRRVLYCGRRDVTASCSHEGNNSVILKYSSGCMKSYVFSVPRGVTCVVVVPHLHIVVGGSQDGQVRVWTDTQPAPSSVLAASSRAAVIDVAVLTSSRNVLCGFNSAQCLDIWDLYEECLLQTIQIQFPFLGVLGKKPDFGTYSIHPGPPYKKRETPSASHWDDDSGSRRSSVYRSETGGLLIQRDSISTKIRQSNPDLECSSLLISCCDHVCVVELSGGVVEEMFPPPGATREARRPSSWNLTQEGTVLEPLLSVPRGQKSKPLTPGVQDEGMLYVKAAGSRDSVDYQDIDVDLLLEKAGLKDILKKDFVLTMGLKHDLNKKLARLENNMRKMSGPVSAGAPFLALSLPHAEELEPGDEMTQRHHQVMSLFGGPPRSIGSTPRSGRSTLSRDKRPSTELDL